MLGTGDAAFYEDASNGSLNTSTFTVPPQQSLPTIGDELSANGISWGYFGEGYDNGHPGPNYCGICDPMQYSSSVITDPVKRANIQHGLEDFDSEASNGTLPAVSFLKPGDDDGHPGYSTLPAFEAFVSHAVAEVSTACRIRSAGTTTPTFRRTGRRSATCSTSSTSTTTAARPTGGLMRKRPVARRAGNKLAHVSNLKR
jgi:hypothetical protein